MQKSALYPAGAVAAHEFFNIGDTYAVEIADDAVLEAACGNREFQCGLLILIMV